MQKQCSDEFDLFLLKKNISGSAENTLKFFNDFFRSQKKNINMSYFLKQPVIEQAKRIDEETESQLDILAPEDKAVFEKSYCLQNKDIMNSNFADLYLHEYAVFCQQKNKLTLEWNKLKKELGSRFYKNQVMLVEYDNKNRTFSLVKRPKGRPRAEDSRKRISLRVSADMLKHIDAYCEENHFTQQEFLLKAITSIIKPEKIATDNPILDLMKQRYDVDGNILAEIQKMQKKFPKSMKQYDVAQE